MERDYKIGDISAVFCLENQRIFIATCATILKPKDTEFNIGAGKLTLAFRAVRVSSLKFIIDLNSIC